ncbi:biopolymer transporter ExbD [Marinimicrobium sp. ABcell2]|uniref:ExbD/TolR family protein n=1 Tax=Marinimicrobium sp. ABcell2 TaxID=3069751 RepID=UPI0027B37F64|nr:biopolymer transporter ExbD [Marinimicrobium sp. ABcell2]MDQ2076644.1 biopolymer transporter ExbD [Marinimicrobium sp. ABcell2]
MKQSLRARRMARHHRRMGRAPKLNLVSLMDIFTILVFFLLVNSSEVEVLTQDKSLQLPDSTSAQQPDNTLMLMVNAEHILVNGRPVAAVRDVMASDEDLIGPLKEELSYRASRARPLTEAEQHSGRPITIMGDRAIPYALLKKIMASCAETDYRDIALAVLQQEGQGGAGAEG